MRLRGCHSPGILATLKNQSQRSKGFSGRPTFHVTFRRNAIEPYGATCQITLAQMPAFVRMSIWMPGQCPGSCWLPLEWKPWAPNLRISAGSTTPFRRIGPNHYIKVTSLTFLGGHCYAHGGHPLRLLVPFLGTWLFTFAPYLTPPPKAHAAAKRCLGAAPRGLQPT